MAAWSPEGKGVGVRHGLSNGPVLGIAARRMDSHRGGADSAHIRARPHPVYFGGTAGWTLFIALVVTLLIRHNDLAASTDWKIVGGGVLVAMASAVLPVLRWLRTEVELVPRSVRCTSGLLRPAIVELDLTQARIVTMEHSVVGRLLGYGRLHVVDEQGTPHVFPPLPDDALRIAVEGRDRRSRPRTG